MKPITPGATLTQPTLVEPGAGTRDLVVLAAGGIPLDEDGTWTLRVFNDSAAEAEVSIAAVLAIPKSRRVLYLSPLGFGPAPENVAHTVNDSVPIEHLVNCAAFYAAFGPAYCDLAAGRTDNTPNTFKRIK